MKTKNTICKYMLTVSALALCASFGAFTTSAVAASVTGTVTGPDGKPLRAAFVQARNAKTKMTVSVLSNNQGQYKIRDLPAGDYRVQIRATGYKADPKSGVQLADADTKSIDFALAKKPVQWSDISLQQGQELLPEMKGKAELLDRCVACHGFQSRMAAVVRDEDGWRDRVQYMRTAMHFFIGRPRYGFDDSKAEDVVHYLTQTFGENSVLPKSPEDLPGYKKSLHEFSDDALRIVYVTYEMPEYNRFSWSAHPDKDGKFWIPYYGTANKIGRLDPQTGQVDEFPVPHAGTAAIHSAVPAPDGTVWLAEQGAAKLGKWDPKTQKITEYQDSWEKHTVRIAPDGMVWSTGGLSRFDPKTETFTHIETVPSAYGIAFDHDGNVWFAENIKDGRIGRVDAKTLKVTKYIPNTPTRPRRINVAADGGVWFGEFDVGKIARFDPKSETFKEYPLPGPKPTPYALAIGSDSKVWYSSEWMDVVGRVDPETGKVTEYPIPDAENSMRDFFLDAKGRIWFGSPPNGKVGYFYLADQ